MLSELLAELNNLLWGLSLITLTIGILILMPKKYSLKLGEHPLVLIGLFALVLIALIQIYA
jgi:hypothetical protein